jgi:uracil-DNA glycosylase
MSRPFPASSSAAERAAILETLAREIAACRRCRDRPDGARLRHEPRPVCVLSATARIAICGQAPGARVHASGIAFLDASGDRLRRWLGVDTDAFYDARRFAIVPMGFCFPGLDRNGGDLPPRKECAGLWHSRVFAAMPQIELFVLVGGYAHRWHLGADDNGNVTATVANWREALRRRPAFAPLPHPSWRNSGWLKRNAWFEAEVLPHLRRRVHALV